MHASNEEEHIGTEQQHLPNGCPANERFYQHLIQCAPNVILFLSLDHLILEFNPEAERLYGRKREDVLGKDYFEEFLPDDDREAVAVDIEKVLTGKPTRGFENAVVTNDGQERVLRWNIDSVLDSEGKPIGIVAVGQDITERKQSDSALNESLQTSDDIVRTIPSGLFIYRYEAPDSLSLLYGNPEAERLTGIKVAEWLGKEFNEIWPNAKEQGITEAFLSPMKTGQTYETEDLYYKDEMLEGAFRVRTFPLTGNKLAVAFENVTERKKTEIALRESEEEFRLITSSAQDAIVMADDQGSISYWNPAAERIFKYKKEETIGRNLAKLIFPERFCEEFSQRIRIYGKTGKNPFVGKTVELIGQRKNNEEFPIELSLSSLRIHDRWCSVGVMRDISERKHTQEALQESENRYRTVVENAGEGIVVAQDGILRFINPHFTDVTGYSEKEFMSRPFIEFVHPDDRELVMGIHMKRLKGKEVPPAYEFRAIHKQGNTMWLENNGILIEWGGRPASLNFIRDITERKEAEQKVKSSEERLKVLFEYAPDAYYMTDLQGRFVDGNLAAEQTIGFKREELIGKSFLKLKLLSLGQIPKAAKLLARSVLGQPTGPDEFVLNRKDGTKVDVEIRTYPVQINGQALVLGIARDITERKKAEEALRAERDKLQALMDGITRAGIGIDIIGTDYKVLFQNQTLEERFGKLLGKPCYEHYVALEEPCDRCPVAEAIQQNVAVEVEQRGYDGRDYQIFSAPVPDADGSVNKAIEIVLDITESTRAKDKLRRSEQRYRAIVEDQTELICRNLPDGTLTFVNDAYCRYFGKSHDELIGQKFMPLIPEEDHQEVKKHFASLGPDNPVATYEHRAIMPNGDIRWHQWTNRVILDDAGKVTEFQGAGRDITKRKLAVEELRESEKRFRSLSEAAFEGIAFTEKGVLVDANEAIAKIYDCSLGELKGRQVIELVAPEHREIVTENIRSGYEGVYEHKGLRKDGSLIDLEVQGRNVEYQGRTMRLTAIRDITEQKKARLALEAEKRFTGKAINAQIDTFFVFNPETGKPIIWNKSFSEISGYSNEEIAAMKAPDSWYSKEDLKKAAVAISNVTKEGYSTVEISLKTKTGEEIPFEYRSSSIKGESNESLIISIGRDITERKRAEDELRESEERLTKAFQASPNLMGIIDLDERRRLLGNDAFARITGYSLEEAAGTTFDELNFWIEPDRLHEAFQFIRQDRVLQDYETDIRTKQGEIRTLTYNAVLLDIPGKNVVAFSAEDITEQKEAEKRIKEYQVQLKSLASELSLAEERERRRIAAGIHDDIAQKLAMAKFELQSLQASVTDTDVSGSLEKQCQLMDQVVADARSLTFELSNPVLYQVGLEAAVESYMTERIQGQFGIKCNFKSEGPHLSLEEDIRVVLFQAVRELLANVVKHANASTVEVYVSNTKDRLRIVVEDDGVGFDSTEIGPHLVGRGGFGLFNIRERLEYLGGNVKIESKRTKGARVTMTVAIRTDAAAE